MCCSNISGILQKVHYVAAQLVQASLYAMPILMGIFAANWLCWLPARTINQTHIIKSLSITQQLDGMMRNTDIHKNYNVIFTLFIWPQDCTEELNVLHPSHFLWKQEKSGSTVSNSYLLWRWPQYTSWPISMAVIPGLLFRHSLWVYPNMNHCWWQNHKSVCTPWLVTTLLSLMKDCFRIVSQFLNTV